MPTPSAKSNPSAPQQFSTRGQQDLVVQGPKGRWQATHSEAGLLGPDTLSVDGDLVIRDCHFRLDDLGDAEGLPDGPPRLSHRSGIAQVRQSGHFPFGANPRMSHTVRYIDGLARMTTDLQVPRGTRVRERVELASMTLPGHWTGLRFLDSNFSWHQVSLPTNVEAGQVHLELKAIPVALVVRRSNGLEVEFGVGNDVWRWQQGLGGAENKGELIIESGHDGLILRVVLSRFAEETEPEVRPYRFNWYLAWNQSEAVPEPLHAPMTANWRDNGDLALRHLADLAPGQPLLLDIRTMPCPEALLRTVPEGASHAPHGMCFASAGMQKRLKRLMRQIHGLERQDFPILFEGLLPGVCSTASHVDRRGQRLHGDLWGILDFTTWARALFGPERELRMLCETADHRPSVAVMFNPGLDD